MAQAGWYIILFCFVRMLVVIVQPSVAILQYGALLPEEQGGEVDNEQNLHPGGLQSDVSKVEEDIAEMKAFGE